MGEEFDISLGINQPHLRLYYEKIFDKREGHNIGSNTLKCFALVVILKAQQN